MNLWSFFFFHYGIINSYSPGRHSKKVVVLLFLKGEAECPAHDVMISAEEVWLLLHGGGAPAPGPLATTVRQHERQRRQPAPNLGNMKVWKNLHTRRLDYNWFIL
jgi:hypothetical protein